MPLIEVWPVVFLQGHLDARGQPTMQLQCAICPAAAVDRPQWAVTGKASRPSERHFRALDSHLPPQSFSHRTRLRVSKPRGLSRDCVLPEPCLCPACALGSTIRTNAVSGAFSPMPVGVFLVADPLHCLALNTTPNMELEAWI